MAKANINIENNEESQPATINGLVKIDKIKNKNKKKQEKINNKTNKKLEKQAIKAEQKAHKEQQKYERFKSKIEKDGVADWFKLDNAAMIYPSIREENWTFVFRVSAILKDKIDVDKLQQAVIDTMPRFPTFNVGLKKGIFWNYFEEIDEFPKVTKEEKFPCYCFDLANGKKHIIRILHYNNRISAECFHAVADGRGVLTFFNSLLRRYFILLGTKIESCEGCLNTLDKPQKEEMEDAFFINGVGNEKLQHGEQKAFKLVGTEEEFGIVNATMGTLSVAQIKSLAKKYDCTISEYLTAVLAFVIWKRNKNHKKPIKISVPIDLRRFFETQTLRNFSGYINVPLPVSTEEYTIESVIKIVKEEFSKINKDYLVKFINGNISIQKNVLIKIVPLFLKNIIIKLCFKAWGETYQTINMSNLGLVKVPEEFSDKIEKYVINLGRPKYNAKTIGLISFNDNMVITFSSKIKESTLEKDFFTYLSKEGINVLIESNRRDVYA